MTSDEIRQKAREFHAVWMRDNIARLHRKNMTPSELEIEFGAAFAESLLSGGADSARKPDGYAYRYPCMLLDGKQGTVIRFSNGQEINGTKPIESIPYYFGAVPPAGSPLTWNSEEIKSFREQASGPQLGPTSHLIRAMSRNDILHFPIAKRLMAEMRIALKAGDLKRVCELNAEMFPEDVNLEPQGEKEANSAPDKSTSGASATGASSPGASGLLAPQSPRCPKCDAPLSSVKYDKQEEVVFVLCYGSCETRYELHEPEQFAQFFPSSSARPNDCQSNQGTLERDQHRPRRNARRRDRTGVHPMSSQGKWDKAFAQFAEDIYRTGGYRSIEEHLKERIVPLLNAVDQYLEKTGAAYDLAMKLREELTKWQIK